jgi:hypothetical protein
MPKGIVRRLIVALHYQIPPGGPLWRSGAVFEYEGSTAEVIEVYRRRLLTIRIRGGDPRVLLGLIDHELGIIHRSYPGIKVKKFLPCDCETCAASSEPTTFEVGELILSKAYLESKNCMYELTQIASHPEFARRVYLVVTGDAGIFDAVTRLGYVKYWERKKAELDAAMREVGQEHLEGVREELDLYEDIRNTISRIMNVLGDMNTLTPQTHRGADFEQLYSQLAAALQV